MINAGRLEKVQSKSVKTSKKIAKVTNVFSQMVDDLKMHISTMNSVVEEQDKIIAEAVALKESVTTEIAQTERVIQNLESIIG